MIEKTINRDEPVVENHYRAWYRCTNCGVIFQFDLPKGTPVSVMKGTCPICGVRSGTANIGIFPIIKYNPDCDKIPQRNYFV